MKMDKNRFFREVTLRVSGSLDISEALRSTLEYLTEFIPVESIGLYRFDTERMAVFPVAEETVGMHSKALLEPLRSLPIDRDLQQRIEESRARDTHVTIHNTPEQLPASVRDCFPHLKANSVIALHLRIKQEDVGGLVLSAQGHHRYTDEHAALLEGVREPIALAMSHAWQYGEMKRLRDQLADDNRALSLDMERVSGNEVVGADFGLSSVMESVRRVAPLSSPVLIQGETGTGKEVIANTIHLLSNRSQ